MEYRLSKEKLEQNKERVINYLKSLGVEKRDVRLICDEIAWEISLELVGK